MFWVLLERICGDGLFDDGGLASELRDRPLSVDWNWQLPRFLTTALAARRRTIHLPRLLACVAGPRSLTSLCHSLSALCRTDEPTFRECRVVRYLTYFYRIPRRDERHPSDKRLSAASMHQYPIRDPAISHKSPWTIGILQFLFDRRKNFMMNT